MLKLFLLLSTVKMVALVSSPGSKSAARDQYDAMAKLVSNDPYPSLWWVQFPGIIWVKILSISSILFLPIVPHRNNIVDKSDNWHLNQ